MGNSLELMRYLQDQNFLLIMMKQFGFHHQITQNDTKNTEINCSTLEKSTLSSLELLGFLLGIIWFSLLISSFNSEQPLHVLSPGKKPYIKSRIVHISL